jgi:hypothetical protein
LNRDEKEVVEVAAAGIGAWVLFRILKFLFGAALLIAAIYFGVHYLVGWHRALPACKVIFEDVRHTLIHAVNAIRYSAHIKL